MRRVFSILCLAFIVLAVSACSDNEDRKVKPTPTTKPPSGVRNVPAIKGDATKDLQQVVNSMPAGATIKLKPGAKYRIDGTLKIKSKQRLTIEGEKSSCLSTSTAAHGACKTAATIYSSTSRVPNTAQISIQGGSNIVIRNITINGVNPNAGTGEAAYNKKRAFEHGIEILGATGVEVDHLTINDVYGDFVYVGRSLTSRDPSRNIWIHDGSFHRNGRQGVGITDANAVLVKDNTFGEARRTLIDLEPGARGNSLSGIFIVHNEVFQSRTNFISAEGQGAVDNVVVKDNILRDHPLAIYAKTPAGSPPRVNWVINHNSSETISSTPTIWLKGINGVEVTDNSQRLARNQPMVDLDRVCGATIDNYDGNAYTKVPTCAAPLEQPAWPSFAPR
jgi:hypothetical protein